MATIITNIVEAQNYNIDSVDIDSQWNIGDAPEFKIHAIHAYPAKFPAFIAEKAINYAKMAGLKVNRISDIFCGCGTVALEAKRQNIDFWGCDINPVATLIAKAKCEDYRVETLERYYKLIKQNYDIVEVEACEYERANERLQYWFDSTHYNDLKKLVLAINQLPNNKYRRVYQCLFSSILKSTSCWLTKSIKPQVDPQKKPMDVCTAFDMQYKRLTKILKQEEIQSNSKVEIVTANILTKKSVPKVDLIVTSPPYVTSYEYADLHQLSTLWLDYTNDYKALRKGTIGSVHNCEAYYFEMMDLNLTGRRIINQLRGESQIAKSKIKSVARYFIDMQHVAQKCFEMLNSNGMAFFVIGDTEYHGIKIYNSKHLVESLINSGFTSVHISKRRVSKKNLTPYRDEDGKFTADKNKREIYHEEFVVIGIKLPEEAHQ